MEANEPLAFGGSDGATLTEVGESVAALKRAHLERRPELHTVARKAIGILEPLDPAARLRVLRAAALPLGLDLGTRGPCPWRGMDSVTGPRPPQFRPPRRTGGAGGGTPGPQGPPGPAGPAGAPGVGVPAGGTAGQ